MPSNNSNSIISLIKHSLWPKKHHHHSHHHDRHESMPELPIELARKILEKNKAAILVDVRDEEEYRESHIPGAVNFPYAKIKENPNCISDDFSAVIFFYSKGTHRSSRAAAILRNAGYENAANIGSIDDWPDDLTEEM